MRLASKQGCSDPTGLSKVSIKLEQGSMKVGSFLPVRCVAS